MSNHYDFWLQANKSGRYGITFSLGGIITLIMAYWEFMGVRNLIYLPISGLLSIIAVSLGIHARKNHEKEIGTLIVVLGCIPLIYIAISVWYYLQYLQPI
ncbi:MAG: hypothetical protein ACTSRK_18345 [Promethearchaeota archaeon]